MDAQTENARWDSVTGILRDQGTRSVGDYDTERASWAHPELAGEWATIAALKRAVKESGSHFFDRDTMRHFRSSALALVGGRFLVTRDRMDDDAPWEYSVRWFVRAASGILDSERLKPFTSEADALWFAQAMAEEVNASSGKPGTETRIRRS